MSKRSGNAKCLWRLKLIITIDGPAGSGKSSLARGLADKLGIAHLNSGLFYRAAALLLLRDAPENAAFQPDQKTLERLDKISLERIENRFFLFIDGHDLTLELTKQNFDAPSARVSQISEVRKKILKIQRQIGQSQSLVIDGRDCGSVVFPNADFKFFLTATPLARAKRIAHRNFKNNYTNEQLAKIEQEIIARDNADKTREHSPLIVPNDAILVDNSNLNRWQTLDQVFLLIKTRKDLKG